MKLYPIEIPSDGGITQILPPPFRTFKDASTQTEVADKTDTNTSAPSPLTTASQPNAQGRPVNTNGTSGFRACPYTIPKRTGSGGGAGSATPPVCCHQQPLPAVCMMAPIMPPTGFYFQPMAFPTMYIPVAFPGYMMPAAPGGDNQKF